MYGDFCYKFVTESVKNWHDAEAQCNKDQAHLASFHTQAELSFITGEQKNVKKSITKQCKCQYIFLLNYVLASAAHMPASAWIGLNDIHSENNFIYSDGTPAVSDAYNYGAHSISGEMLLRIRVSAACLCVLSGLPALGS